MLEIDSKSLSSRYLRYALHSLPSLWSSIEGRGAWEPGLVRATTVTPLHFVVHLRTARWTASRNLRHTLCLRKTCITADDSI